MNSPRPNSRGFTLLEMLVATALMAMLAGSLYAGLRIAFKARTSAESAIGAARRLELVMELISRDLKSAVIPNGILAGAFIGEDGEGVLGDGGDSLLLHCTTTGRDDSRYGDIQMIELSCDPSGDSDDYVLVRRVNGNLLATTVPEPTEEVLCRGISDFNLSYFDGTDWLDTWDAASHDNALPQAIEVTIELKTAEPTRQGLHYRMSRIFSLPCAAPTSNGVEVAGR